MKMKNLWVLGTALIPLAVVAGPAGVNDRAEPISITSSSHPSGDHDRALLAALKTKRVPRREGVGITPSSHPSGDHDGRNPARYSRTGTGCCVPGVAAVCPVQTGALGK